MPRRTLPFAMTFSILLTASASAQGTSTEFERARATMLSGRPAHVTVDLAKCRDGDGRSGPPIVGVFAPEAVQIQTSSIVFASSHFSVHPDGKPTLEFSSFKAEPTGDVTITTTFLDVPSYATSRRFQMRCPLGSAVKVIRS